jgi:hypothetical protein
MLSVEKQNFSKFAKLVTSEKFLLDYFWVIFHRLIPWIYLKKLKNKSFNLDIISTINSIGANFGHNSISNLKLNR